MANSSSLSLIDRFPHLQREILRLLDQDSGFSQLNYRRVFRNLETGSHDQGSYTARDELGELPFLFHGLIGEGAGV